MNALDVGFVSKMIRVLIKNLKNVSFTQHFLNPSISSTLISKRFEFTNILESAKKKEDFKFDKLKRYREAEVKDENNHKQK